MLIYRVNYWTGRIFVQCVDAGEDEHFYLPKQDKRGYDWPSKVPKREAALSPQAALEEFVKLKSDEVVWRKRSAESELEYARTAEHVAAAARALLENQS